MKKIIHYTIPIFLIIFLINPAFGFAGMTASNSTAQPDLNNTTESDQDIVFVQSLIEVDAVQLQSENRLLVRETLIFRNEGEKNFSGNLRTWVPDKAEEIKVGRIEMMMGAAPRTMAAIQNGNIISWQDFVIANNPLPPLYVVEYTLPAKPEGTLTKAIHYSKVLLYPTLTKQPNRIVLKVIKSKEENVAVTDEKGSSISAAGNPREEDSSVLYGWELPEFKEFNIEISKPAITPAGIAGYVILGIVILLVISYPLIRKKSGRIQAIEEKIRSTLRQKEIEETEAGAAEETIEGKTKEELENQKTEMLSKLGELDKDYESGNLLDEEYEELRKSYQEKAERITRKIEQHR
ncbi:MAG: hypothetical protein L6244_01430 [Candidatus Methanoperedenaceae archaeon]|nr:hypothetical protein [Candidatus Methanoperedenaceae archaeon]